MLSFYEKAADDSGYIYFHKYEVKNSPAQSATLHFHDSIEFIFMLQGESLVRINSEEKRLTKGEIGFSNCFDTHDYKPEKGAQYYVVLISSKFLSSYDFQAYTFAPFIEKTDGFEQIRAFLDMIYPIWEGAEDNFRLGFVQMLLGLMTRLYPLKEKEKGKAAEIMVAALRYINERFFEEITLESLAFAFGYSKNYFSNLFNRFAGMDIREYLNRRRVIEFMKLRHSSPDMPIYKAAQACGFQSQNTFYRAYKKYADVVKEK